MGIESLNRVEISTGALRHNFQVCRGQAAGAAVLAMVKADGYGHGMLECAEVFAEEGVSAFGVAETLEGVKLREHGLRHPVYVFTGIYPEIIGALFDYDLTPVLVNADPLRSLSREAVRRKTVLDVHVKIDAGMGRQGCNRQEFQRLAAEIGHLDGLRLAGVLAHFPMSDDRDSGSTMEIYAGFQKALTDSVKDLPDSCCRHLANSGALFYYPQTRLEMVRPGISLYGYYPDAADRKSFDPECSLRPVMRFSSRIIQLREIPSGTGLGYGHTHITDRDTRLAVAPVGYANGYLRSLSNKGVVLVKGVRAPVLGRVSMNLILVDVTDIAGVREGEEVVMLGSQGDAEITADEIAAWMGTISYEVLCLFGNLNPRYYVA